MKRLAGVVRWARANVEYAPFAVFVLLVVYVQMQWPDLFVLLKLVLLIVLAAGAVIIYVILRDGPDMVRAAVAKPLPRYEPRTVPLRAEPAYRAPTHQVPTLPTGTRVVTPQPAPIDLDDDSFTVPMPPPPEPVPGPKVQPVSGQPVAWPLLNTQRVTFTDPIPVGFREDGTVEHVSLRERNLLLGGEIGSGKSTAIQMIVAAAALDPNVQLYLFDAKLVELQWWKGCAEQFVEDSTAAANDVLTQLLTEMRRRYRFMQANNLRQLAPTAEFPLLLVVIDELAEFTDDDEKSDLDDPRSPTLGRIFSTLLTRLASLGRAACIVPVAATQEPRYDVVPPKLRNKFVFRWAFRCQRQSQVDIILGDGWNKDAPAHKIRGDEKGVGYLLHEGAEPVRLQAFYLSDSDIRAIAARAEAIRRGTTSRPLPDRFQTTSADEGGSGRPRSEVVAEVVPEAVWRAFHEEKLSVTQIASRYVGGARKGQTYQDVIDRINEILRGPAPRPSLRIVNEGEETT